MSLIHRRVTAALAATVLALGATALTACGNIAEQAVEGAAEQALGGEGDVNLEDGQITVTQSDGTEVSLGEDVAIPDGWPSEVPTYDGGTLMTVMVGPDGSSADAMWATEATPEEAVAEYGSALEAAGYTAGEQQAAAGMSMVEYTGNGFTVTVSGIGDGTTTSLIVGAVRE